MTPKVWGPPVWIFLHTFSVNISEYGYSIIGMQFYSFITRICRLLPCPECSEHATKFISSVKPGLLKTKYDMANMLCTFHNSVNSRKKTPLFNYSNLAFYENVPIISAFNNFVKAFTIPSQRYMNDNLHRKMLVSQLNQFMTSNIIFFIKPQPQPQLQPPIEEINKIVVVNTENENVDKDHNNITYEVSFNDSDSIPDNESDVESENN